MTWFKVRAGFKYDGVIVIKFDHQVKQFHTFSSNNICKTCEMVKLKICDGRKFYEDVTEEDTVQTRKG